MYGYGYQTRTTTTTPHCEMCGTDNPQTDDGYTTCCNELQCDGGPEYTWAIGSMGTKADNWTRTQTGTVRACCSAKAEAKVRDRGLDVLHREH